jgi:hypothetical protein
LILREAGLRGSIAGRLFAECSSVGSLVFGVGAVTYAASFGVDITKGKLLCGGRLCAAAQEKARIAIRVSAVATAPEIKSDQLGTYRRK